MKNLLVDRIFMFENKKDLVRFLEEVSKTDIRWASKKRPLEHIPFFRIGEKEGSRIYDGFCVYVMPPMETDYFPRPARLVYSPYYVMRKLYPNKVITLY